MHFALEQSDKDIIALAMRRQDGLKLLLLDMISTTRSVAAERTKALDRNDWAMLCVMAKQHRLMPLLHHRHRTIGSHWIIPPEVSYDWAESFRRSALRALANSGVLARLNRILSNADIPYAALKGAWLSQHAYADPAIRPMRDIDIIVAPEHSLAVFQLLTAQGFYRKHEVATPLEYALLHAKHLPPLQCASTGVSVEIHTRLMDNAVNKLDASPLNKVKLLLERAEYHDGIPYLSAVDALLHLIVHAVYDHKFNNGPLTFSDVAVLVEKSTIDWPKFWEMAKEGNWERGCCLILDIASSYHRIEGWTKEAPKKQMPSSDVVKSASLLALQDFSKRGVVEFHGKLATSNNSIKRLHLMLHRAFPALHTLAAFAGSETVTWKTVFHYPSWLFNRVKEVLSNRLESRVAIEVKHSSELNGWLNGCGS